MGNGEAKRDLSMDIVKGIGIILMVVGHSKSPFTAFIYSFHMPLFFIVSGYLFNIKYSESLKSSFGYMVKKLKELYIPYCVWTGIFVICNNLFIYCNIYTDNPLLLESFSTATLHKLMSLKEIAVEVAKGFCFLGGAELGGAFWFLRTLFCISILYCFVQHLMGLCFKSKTQINFLQLLISIIFFAIGYIVDINGITFAGISYIFTYYIMYCFGHIIKEVDLESYLNSLMLPLLSLSILVVINVIQTKYSFSPLSNSLLKLVTSFAGWFFVLSIAKKVLKLPIVGKALIIAGKNTLSIVILHFLCFKVVALAQVICYKKPKYMIAAFPVLDGNHGWWIVYSIAGVCLPLLISYIWQGVKAKIYLKKSRA